MILLAKAIVVAFGLFIICSGILMLFAPEKARETLSKAGSTNLINYAELTLRMVPALGLVIYSDFSRYPLLFHVLGWFMIATSSILLLVPRQLHYNFSLKCSKLIKPVLFQVISPLAFAFGGFLLYAVLT